MRNQPEHIFGGDTLQWKLRPLPHFLRRFNGDCTITQGEEGSYTATLQTRKERVEVSSTSHETTTMYTHERRGKKSVLTLTVAEAEVSYKGDLSKRSRLNELRSTLLRQARKEIRNNNEAFSSWAMRTA